jgi:hypothetical protein
VRLDNHHLVTAYPPRRKALCVVPDVGERVLIEMAPDDLRGWRFLRRP